MAESSHFVAVCRIYPEFSFVVQELRKYRKERGDTFPSGFVRFEHGILNTEVQGLDETEAKLIFAKLSARKSRPVWGSDITLYSDQSNLTGYVPDGKLACPVCRRHFDNNKALAKHLYSHEEKQDAA